MVFILHIHPDGTFPLSRTSVISPIASAMSLPLANNEPPIKAEAYTTEDAENGYSAAVARKWQGTEQDKHDMLTLGRVQQLRVSSSLALYSRGAVADNCNLQRNFRLASMVGFNAILIQSWEIVLPYVFSSSFRACNIELVLTRSSCHSLLSVALIDGGTAGLIWGYIAVFIGFVMVYASLAEMASMYAPQCPAHKP